MISTPNISHNLITLNFYGILSIIFKNSKLLKDLSIVRKIGINLNFSVFNFERSINHLVLRFRWGKFWGVSKFQVSLWQANCFCGYDLNIFRMYNRWSKKRYRIICCNPANISILKWIKFKVLLFWKPTRNRVLNCF